MSRTFQDRDFLVWEAFPSAGDFGYSERAHLVFNCLTDRLRHVRFVELDGNEADGERILGDSSEPQLHEMLDRARPVV